MFHLKLNDMSTILEEYSCSYGLSCNMIGTITIVIVGSMRRSLFGILRVNRIVICIILWILYKILSIVLLYANKAHSCHHARFDLILFINDAMPNTFVTSNKLRFGVFNLKPEKDNTEDTTNQEPSNR